MGWFPRRPEVHLLPAILSLALLFAILYFVDVNGGGGALVLVPGKNQSAGTTRKLFGIVGERMGVESCSKDDVVVYQGATAPLPNGIPTYTVQVLNVCSTGCAVADIHVSCGWFSSARLINPRVFRRLGYDDCLVNDGAVLRPGQSLSFQYANTYPYPLYVSSVSCT
ncbi:TPD1 protein homolog 1-like [Elaeis guineensis]|uniref:TPD1 protein homolog 1-like n=1 Tax=Elaeis guineensis var. tenera TaxID=51953 RepID=A0A6I9S1Y6_ELAGV|nr:TPD1 protein homolog 1-like [Elaeis guineensis]